MCLSAQIAKVAYFSENSKQSPLKNRKKHVRIRKDCLGGFNETGKN
jgi:hypothetical protein